MQDVQDTEKEPPSRLNVAEHVILNTPLHRDWLPVFVFDSGCAPVAGVFLHFQLKFSVELGLCLHLLGLGCLNVIYIFASIGLSLGFDLRLLHAMSYRKCSRRWMQCLQEARLYHVSIRLH
jgi:hypothetical protein